MCIFIGKTTQTMNYSNLTQETKEWCQYCGKVLLFVLLLMVCCGCKTVTKVVHDISTIQVTDTLRDTTVLVKLEKETVEKIVSPKDTLRMENKYAKATCWLDQQNCLTGKLVTQDAEIPTKVKIRDRVITKEKKVEVPVEVVKYRTPKWVGILLLLVGGYFFLKIRTR